MSSQAYTYLDGNAAAGELDKIFAFDHNSCARTVCPLWSNKAFCRSSLVHEMPGYCGALRRLPTRTASSRKHWWATTSRSARHDLACRRSVRIPVVGRVVLNVRMGRDRGSSLPLPVRGEGLAGIAS
jgi:hypothetical protein